MKATDFLRKDHRKVRELFRRYERLGEGPSDRKRALFQQIKLELVLHADVEEKIFYPALEALSDDEGRALVRKAREEHRVVKSLLEELSASDAADRAFDLKVRVLRENVEHHAEEEEQELFSEAKKLPAERLEEMAIQMESRKKESGMAA